MAGTKENMVLRTVYLPNDLDRVLRELAFSRDVSKADLIRDFIRQGLGDVRKSGEKTLADKIQERIDSRQKTMSKAFENPETGKEAKKRPSRRAAAPRAAHA